MNLARICSHLLSCRSAVTRTGSLLNCSLFFFPIKCCCAQKVLQSRINPLSIDLYIIQSRRSPKTHRHPTSSRWAEQHYVIFLHIDHRKHAFHSGHSRFLYSPHTTVLQVRCRYTTHCTPRRYCDNHPRSPDLRGAHNFLQLYGHPGLV